MIEINLVPGTKKKRAAGGGFAFSLGGLKQFLAKVKDPLLIGSVGAWVAAGLFVGLFWLTDTQRLVTMGDDLTRIEAEQRRFAALIAQKRKAEQLRDSLVVELAVIRSIDGQRFVWPHILEEVTRAVPDYTWLMGLEPLSSPTRAPAPGNPAAAAAAAEDSTAGTPVKFTVTGRTSDIQAYTRFLRQLANSPWITDIVAGPTTTVVEENRPVTAFSLTAVFKRADSTYIRTAPLLQTLR